MKFEAKKPTALKPYLFRTGASREVTRLFDTVTTSQKESYRKVGNLELVEKTMRNRISHPGNTFLSFWGYCNWFMISQYCGQYLNFKLFGHVCQLSSTFIKPVT